MSVIQKHAHVPVLDSDYDEHFSRRAWQISIGLHLFILLALIIEWPWQSSLPDLKVIRATIVELQPTIATRPKPRPKPKPVVETKPEVEPKPTTKPDPKPEVSEIKSAPTQTVSTTNEQALQEQIRRAEELSYMEALLAEEEESFAVENPGLLDEYRAKIRQKVQRYWVQPPSATSEVECTVVVQQMPGGDVTDVEIGQCNGDDAVRRSIEHAVYKASPLPLPSDPRLFERSVIFNFRPK